MLNKEICLCCVREYYPLQYTKLKRFYSVSNHIQHFNHEWDNSFLCECPYACKVCSPDFGEPHFAFVYSHRSINKSPPEDCPYALEQLVNPPPTFWQELWADIKEWLYVLSGTSRHAK